MSIQLAVPVGPRDHVLGSHQAPITLVEYGDYECSYCGAAYPIVKSLVRRLGADLCFAFRNFPLREVHAHAALAAESAEAAGAQGVFWEMHDLLFENQNDLTCGALVRYAATAVPDAMRWASDMQERRFSARVREDSATGSRSGVRGTPTFFINGVQHVGSFDEVTLLFAIEAAHEARLLRA